MNWTQILQNCRGALPTWLRWAAWLLAAVVVGALAMAALVRVLTPRRAGPVTDTATPHVEAADTAAAQADAADARADAQIEAYATEAQAMEADHATVAAADSIAAVDAVLYGKGSRAPQPPHD